MSTGTPVKNPPGNSGLTVGAGASAISGGTDKLLFYQDGTSFAQAQIFYDKASGRMGVASAPNTGLSQQMMIQVIKSNPSGEVGYFNQNTSTSGWATWRTFGQGGPGTYVNSYGSTATGTILGRNKAAASSFVGDAGLAMYGTTAGGGAAVVGANDVEVCEFKDTTGARFAKAVAITPTALTGAAIAATSAVGAGNFHFSAPGANRAHTLCARSSVTAGYRVTYSVVGSIGGFQVQMTANGTDTILGAASTYNLTTDYGSVTFEACGTTDWLVVAKS